MVNHLIHVDSSFTSTDSANPSAIFLVLHLILISLYASGLMLVITTMYIFMMLFWIVIHSLLLNRLSTSESFPVTSVMRPTWRRPSVVYTREGISFSGNLYHAPRKLKLIYFERIWRLFTVVTCGWNSVNGISVVWGQLTTPYSVSCSAFRGSKVCAWIWWEETCLALIS